MKLMTPMITRQMRNEVAQLDNLKNHPGKHALTDAR
jgi:hypothetical protein